jgi:hypothetical protein
MRESDPPEIPEYPPRDLDLKKKKTDREFEAMDKHDPGRRIGHHWISSTRCENGVVFRSLKRASHHLDPTQARLKIMGPGIPMDEDRLLSERSATEKDNNRGGRDT